LKVLRDFLRNNTLFPIVALACLATNRLFVPIDYNNPSERNDQIIQEAGLAAVILNRTDEIKHLSLAATNHLHCRQPVFVTTLFALTLLMWLT
jgi:acyl-CoA synthetase (AMP-forming)/AMP-acid ligase II